MSGKPTVLFDFTIRHVWHRVSRMYNQKAAEIGITMSMGFILMTVDKEGTPSTQLGPRMGMEPTSLSRTLKTMEERGLLLRKESLKDKRIVYIHLTKEGAEQRKLVRDFLYEFNNDLLEDIAPSKVKVFTEVMQKIDASIEKELNKQLIINSEMGRKLIK